MPMPHKGRYSMYLRPISILIDLIIINISAAFFFKELNLIFIYFILYQSIGWNILAFSIGFYDVYRFTTPIQIITKIVKQAVLFLLVVIAFFPFSKEVIFSGKAIAFFMVCSIFLVLIFKYLFFYYLKKYRIVTGSNFRNAIIIGYTPQAIQLKDLFEKRNDYGYRFLGFFSDKNDAKEIKGNLHQIKPFILKNKVDEIYCSINEISDSLLKDLIDFADEHRKTIKFIPDSKEIFAKNLRIDYYEMFPVLSLQKTTLHDPITQFFKRFFDILFAFIVIIGLLSWLVPLLSILIKIESKGPAFFKQGRPGINEEEFFCYKFRSMKINVTTEREASKDDPRVTKIGRFIRKTSIDEMPQFLNVLLGEMSVVGPRPHLWSQNKIYGNKIKKYTVRHYVKPGITGLAQIRGFRGEIQTDEDMINRIKYDVFYIENWSFVLDLKIIIQTVVNIFKGEDKAY